MAPAGSYGGGERKDIVSGIAHGVSRSSNLPMNREK